MNVAFPWWMNPPCGDRRWTGVGRRRDNATLAAR
jgi:hypothetical protein